ncbi:hypothetical protein BJV77DRAFT_554331 [Russula vinacea]|nr:hypothetical protein BJV77DRAFT_554331 [Russula vinacea]
MILLLKLAILFVVYSNEFSVVAHPLPTRADSSAASIFTGYASILALSTSTANTSQPEMGKAKAAESSREPGTRSLPELQQVRGTVDGAAATLDATTIVETITRGTPSPFVVATTAAPNNLNELWSNSRKITVEPTDTVTNMTATAVGVGAKETLSVSLPADNPWDNTCPTLSSPIAMMKVATPESPPGDCGQESNDRSSGKNGPSRQEKPSPDPTGKEGSCSSDCSSAGTSSPEWWDTIPTILPLLQWAQIIMVSFAVFYAFVKEVLAYTRSRPQPCKSAVVPVDYGHNGRKLRSERSV